MKRNKKWISLITSASLFSAVVMIPSAILAEGAPKVSESAIQEKLPELLNEEINQSILDQYEVIGKDVDKFGMTHYTLGQSIDGIQADNGVIKVHADKNGKILSVSGEVNKSEIELESKPSISEEEAVKIAKKHFNVESDVYQQKQWIDEDGVPFWDVKLAAVNPTDGSHEYKINAINGEIIKESAGQKGANSTKGKGRKHNGTVIDIPTATDGRNYYLIDNSGKEAVNIVFDYRTRNRAGEYAVISSRNNQFNDAAAVDAYDHAKAVYNYYSKTFNYKGVDGRDAPIKSFVHLLDKSGNLEANAYWLGDTMYYGAINGTSFAAALDIVGHETTHGVINNTSNLAYEFQSGALNESLADTFGYFVDPGNWTMGEALGVENQIRDLSNPSRHGQPEHMKDYVNLPASNDHGGVHTNSGIMNKAAYNVISAIGKEKAEQIFFQVMRYYLNNNSQFSDMRDAMVQATNSIYPNDKNTLIAVNNAYAAVGIGEMIQSASQDNTRVNSNYYLVPDSQVRELDFYDYVGFRDVPTYENTSIYN